MAIVRSGQVRSGQAPERQTHSPSAN